MLANREIRNGMLGALVLGVGIAALQYRRRTAAARPSPARVPRRLDTPRTRRIHAAHRLNRASGLIAISTLLDSGVEHYRGSFENKAMFTPLATSALTLAVSAHGTGDSRPGNHGLRDATYAAAALTGVVGTGFHVYNVGKRPGGFSWQNLFYGSPLGAPGAVSLVGLLGYYSERLRDKEADRAPTVFGQPAGGALAALTSAGLAATTAEAALLHFRGAYHDPFMYVPVTVPPVAALLLGGAAVRRARGPRRLTRQWLRLTAAAGFAGAGFHVLGVSRSMGGWYNWSQNVLNGPPIPTPPSFTGLALAGLAALDLLEDDPDA